MSFILSPPALTLRFRQNNDPTPSGDYQPSRSLSMAGSESSIDVSITQPIVDNRHLDTEIDFDSTWTLVGKINSITVLGITYYNIAVVENVIIGQYIGLNGEVEQQNRVITYWLSRGVGMVKSTGAFLVDEKTLLVELENYTVQD